MDEYYCEIPLTNSRVLCIGPVTRKEAESADSKFCDGFGTYLFIANADNPSEEIDILAKVVSDEATERLALAFQSASRATSRGD
jgi:hypothetical protein